MTPILRNWNNEVQKSLINVFCKIFKDSNEELYKIDPNELIRISIDLLDFFNVQSKLIKNKAIKCFGYLALIIGPSDILLNLINNLKVQDRSSWICSSLAISIIAEKCGSFTVLPILLNEYRIPMTHI